MNNYKYAFSKTLRKRTQFLIYYFEINNFYEIENKTCFSILSYIFQK